MNGIVIMTSIKGFMEDSIIRYKYLLFIVILFLLSFALIGILFNLIYGLWYGVGVALLLLIAFVKWGEKIVLIFARARYVTDDESLVNQVKNFCCHLSMPEVKVYWSNIFINNLYYTDSRLGDPALIIGKNLYRTFSRNELNSLIYASLLRIKTGEARNRTMTTLIFFILYSPTYLIHRLLPSRLAKGVRFFLYPAFVLKSRMYENEKELQFFDQRVGQMSGLKKDYIAALFKTASLPAINELSIGSMILGDLSLAKNQTSDPLADLMVNRIDVKQRIKLLSIN